MLQRKLSAILAGVVLSACAGTPSYEEVENSGATTEKLAEIYGAEVRQNSLWFRVESTGCTRKEDFKLVLEETSDTVVKASLYRLKPDYCRAMPRIIAIDIQHKMLLKPSVKVVVQNPIKDSSELRSAPRG